MSASTRALAQFTAALRGMGIRFFVGGSVASSMHGLMRSTEDIDIVAELIAEDVPRLTRELGADFEVDEEGLKDAARRKASENIYYLPEFTRFDIYVPADTPFNRSRMSRRQEIPIPGAEGALVPVASAEDTVIKKLEWYRKGNEVSSRQWNDALGILKTQGRSLDQGYMSTWAQALGLSDLLARALTEANAPSGSRQ